MRSSGLMDASARGSSFASDNALSGSLTTVLGSEAVGDLRFQAATRHAVLRTNEPFGPEIDWLLSGGPTRETASAAKIIIRPATHTHARGVNTFGRSVEP